MPSVEAIWKGRCVDRQVQMDLCEHIAKLSEVSNRKFKDYFGIQVNSTLFNVAERESNYLTYEGFFRESKPSAHLEKVENGVQLAKGIGLFGIEFPLYDPRNYTQPFALGDCNRMSFVFTRSQDPELDGHLVQALSINQQHCLSDMAELLLVHPTLHLRYYLQSWTGKLLGWVKHFYMPDLYYWLYGDYVFYDTYKAAKPCDEQKELWFNKLLADFIEQADGFTQDIQRHAREREKLATKSAIKPMGERNSAGL